MTLEEAIERAEKVARSCESLISNYASDRICAAEHRQLAEWLKELAERRKLPEIIYCKHCENWDTTWQNDSAPNYHYCPMMDGSYSGDFYCGRAERRTDGTD